MNLFYGIALRAQQTLENSRMLGIDRIDGRLMRCRRSHYQRARRHQGFLIGQSDGFARLDGRERGLEAAEADHGRHYHIYLRRLNQLAGSVYAQMHLHPGKRIPHLLVLLRIANDHMRHG